MVELPADRARALGLAFVGDHPLVRRGILLVGHGERVASAWTLAPARELVAHLAGAPRVDPDCVWLAAPAEVIHDAAQARADRDPPSRWPPATRWRCSSRARP